MRFQAAPKVVGKPSTWMLGVTACLLFGMALTPAASAQDFVVNSTADRVDRAPGDKSCDTGQKVGGSPECTLRAAVDEVNALSQQSPGTSYTVSLPAGTYFLTTMETCPYHDAGNPNLLSRTATTVCISGNLTLSGVDPATTIIDGGNIDRMFFVSVGATVSISNVTIQNGTLAVSGSFDGSGGGINNQGTLTLTNDVFTHNSDNNPSHDGGGAIYNGGTLVVEGCSFIANADTAITANYATNTSINLSYFAQNTAFQGAAVSTFIGPLQISNSSFVNNTVEENGIIFAYNGVATITNSTISNNIVQNSGTLMSGGNGSSMILDNDTIYGNVARTGEADSEAGLVADNASIANTILAGNSATDCTVISLINYGHNIIETANFEDLCRGGQNSTTLTGVDPQLGPLTGAVLPTRTPLPGSPAIHAGSGITPGSNSISACTALDQLGFVRGVGGACTIGAVEANQGAQSPAILPTSHGASGSITAVIYGGGFNTGSTVAFQLAGKPTLVPTQTYVDGSARTITVTLNLTGAASGKYDVVVTAPGGRGVSLPAAFTVENPAAPDLYGYAIGAVAARAGRPAFYSFVYGNNGNVDAYLVPLTISTPGTYAELISSPIFAPPATSGQAIHDFSDVPLAVSPAAAAGYTNIPLLVPLIPAHSQGILMFSITPPANFHGESTYSYDANLGDPYGQGSDGSPSAAVVTDAVNGAKSYAEAHLGVTISASTLVLMTSYATQQLTTELSDGKLALLESAQGKPIFFSTAQLSIDIAAYGASLSTRGAAASSPTSRKLVIGPRPAYEGQYPDTNYPKYCYDAQTNPHFDYTKCDICHNRGVMAPGTTCDAISQCTGKGCADCAGERDDFGVCHPDPDRGPDPDECVLIPNHKISDDGMRCVPINKKGCSLVTNILFGDPLCGTYKLSRAIDPNSKDGPLGVGANHFTRAGSSSAYQIEFENEATATGAAQAVTVTDQLDTSKLDLSTFQLGPISFGKYVLTPSPGLKSYSYALDLRPDMNVIVSIKAALNASTGVASWSFNSLDPATMKFTTDAVAGFLPPDTTPPAGIGHVAFTIKPLAGLVSGTQICNTASVVFDTNAPIATAPFCNIKDTAAPTSHILALPASTSNSVFTVSWTGVDAGVGVAGYSVFVNDNGGPFVPFVGATTATTASFTGKVGHQYGFYSLATDQLGNVESAKRAADSTTIIGTVASIAVPNVVGLTQANATAALSGATLNLGTVSLQSSATVASGNVISQSPAAGIKVAAKSAVNLVVSSGPAPVVVPTVIGLTQAAAASSIAAVGLVVGTVSSQASATVAAGLVISESPAAGTSVAPKSTVSCVVSSGSATVKVPNVVGATQANASTAITSAGLMLGPITLQSSATIAAGLVISETPTAGSSVAAKSPVSLVVSSGAAPVTVPNVLGVTQAVASGSIATAGLVVGTVTNTSNATVAAGLVVSESPTAGSKVAPQSAINLVVSTGPLIGDVNGDGVVNCADLAIVKASFGKSTGQAGFDARADVNHDGIVNIVDLSMVSHAIPAGTTCN